MWYVSTGYHCLLFCSAEGPSSDRIAAAAYTVLKSTMEGDLEDQEVGAIVRERI